MSKHPHLIREQLGASPEGHAWITVWLQPTLEENLKAWSNPNAVAGDSSGAALVRTSDKRVVEVWRSGHHVGLACWIRNDTYIPAAQRSIDHGTLVHFCNPSGRDWLHELYVGKV